MTNCLPVAVLDESFVRPSSGPTMEEESNERRDEDVTDCLTDRQMALNEPQSAKLYVPECTLDGRYNKVKTISRVIPPGLPTVLMRKK